MRIGITGSHGFIGSVLRDKLIKRGHEVYPYLRPDLKRLYLFGSPSSQILYDYAPDYCRSETTTNFINALRYCAVNDIKLIYPSSATVYNQNNDYARTKAWCEMAAIDQNALGFRIFAGYGYEESKGEYASIVYQFCKQMKKGERPVIWGDGTQTRDFIYVDDVVDNIIKFSDLEGVKDIGTGRNTSFNEVVRLINYELGTDIQPIYKDKPTTYIQETPCREPVVFKYSVAEGVREILKKL